MVRRRGQKVPWFDAQFYVATYPDVAAQNFDALEHYMSLGWREGRNPSARFSTTGYLLANSDVRASGINPLVHFLEHGVTEGRSGWQT
jgi:hypothetical protein